MIKINFIATELAHEKIARIKRYLTLIYSVAWVISFLFLYLQYQKKQSIISSHYKEIKKIKLKVDKLSPQFQQAVQLYQQRNQHRQKLAKVFDISLESSFVLESLEIVANNIPENIWLNEIQISALDSKELTDNNNKSDTHKKSMFIKGNLVLDLENKNTGQIQQFQNTLQQFSPFSLAQSHFDLSDMNVNKLEERYYHNFIIEFNWLNNIL
ncbi:MAG: hypothetical protein ACE5JB_10920 [bacterium]